MFALLPIWSRILIAVVALGSAWALGDLHGHKVEGDEKEVVIAQQQHAFDERIHASDVALAAANDRTAKLELGTAAAVNEATTKYRSTINELQSQIVANAVRVAALSSGRERVRVDAVCRPANAGSSSPVSSPPAAPSGGDGTATGSAELSAGAAGRVSAVANAATEEVAALRAKLVLAQDYARAAYAQCGPQTAPQSPSAPKPLPRTVLKLGAPNPYDR